MTKVGRAYKPAAELRQSDGSDLDITTLITVTNPSSTEDFTVDIMSFRGFVIGENLTDQFIPLWDEGNSALVNSPLRFDAELNLLVSTAEIQVPPGTVFIGEDVALRNHGGFISSTNLQIQDTGILIGRSYGGSTTPSVEGLDGSEVLISVPMFAEEELDFPAQPLDDEELTVSGTGNTIFVFTEVLPAMITNETLRGVFGKCTWVLQTAKDPADNLLSDEDFLLLPDNKLIIIVDGLIGLEKPFDFDDPKDRDGLTDGNGTDFVRYKVPVDFDLGRKIKVTTTSTNGQPFRIKGHTVNGRFTPFFLTDFHLRTTEHLSILDDDLTTEENHWSAQKIQDELDFKIDDALNVGSGAEVFKEEDETTLIFRTIESADSVQVTQGENKITIGRWNAYDIDVTGATTTSETPQLIATFTFTPPIAGKHDLYVYSGYGAEKKDKAHILRFDVDDTPEDTFDVFTGGDDDRASQNISAVFYTNKNLTAAEHTVKVYLSSGEAGKEVFVNKLRFKAEYTGA